MNKYEKLVEYLMNEEIDTAKADELFHQIVVEKSRDIYESLMDMEDELGGDPTDELMNDISVEEEGMFEDDDDLAMDGDMEDGMDNDFDMDGNMDDHEMDHMDGDHADADLEDRVVDIEDQLEDLMAEFDAMMGGDDMEGGDMDDMEMGDEDMDMGDNDMGMDDDMGDEEMEMEGMFNENVVLTKVTKGISNSTEEGTVNKRSVNANNTGAKGSAAKPHQQVGEETGGTAPTVKPGTGTTSPKQGKVTEPKKKGEVEGTNKKSLTGS